MDLILMYILCYSEQLLAFGTFPIVFHTLHINCLYTWSVPLVKWKVREALGPVFEKSSYYWTQLINSLPTLFPQGRTDPVSEILCSIHNRRRVIISLAVICDDNLKYWNMYFVFFFYFFVFFSGFHWTLMAEMDTAKFH